MAEHDRQAETTEDRDEAVRAEIRAQLRRKETAESEEASRRKGLTEPEKAAISMALANQSQYV